MNIKMKKHYTYLLMFTDGMLYHGVRSCEGEIVDDEYWGSSRHTPETSEATKFILTTHDTRKEAVAEEVRYHYANDVSNNDNYHNKAKQTSTGFDTAGTTLSDDHKAKIKAKPKDQMGEKNHMFGKKQPESYKTYMSEINTGENNPMFGTLPWDSTKGTDYHKEIWSMAQEMYDWWLPLDKTKREGHGNRKMAKVFNQKAVSTHGNIQRKFREGWIPNQDSEWVETFE